jgi:O-antigen/teichoic acid export membrane protein
VLASFLLSSRVACLCVPGLSLKSYGGLLRESNDFALCCLCGVWENRAALGGKLLRAKLFVPVDAEEALFSLKKKKPGRGLIFSVLHIAASNGVKSVLTLGSSLIVARFLGPTVMGHLGTARLIGQYGGLANIGANLGMGQQVPILRGKGDEDGIKAVKGVVLWYIYLLSMLGLLTIPIFLFLPLDWELRLVITGGVLFFIVSLFQQYINVNLSVERRFRQISLMNVGVAIVTALTIPAAFLALPGALARLVFLTGFEFVLGYYFIRCSLRGVFSWPVFSQVIKVGFPILVVAFLHQFTFVWDRTMVRALMGAEALGFYTISSLVISTSAIFPQAISRVLYPTVGEIYGRTKDAKKAAREVLRVFPWVLGMGLLVVPVGYFSIPPFVDFFLPKYSEGIVAAQVATLAATGIILCYSLFFFNIIRRVRYIILCEVFGVLCQSGVSYVCYTKYQLGLVSFSLGACVGLIVIATTSLFFVFLIAGGKWVVEENETI